MALTATHRAQTQAVWGTIVPGLGLLCVHRALLRTLK